MTRTNCARGRAARRLVWGLALPLAFAATSALASGSGYGCRNLLTSALQPSIEGSDGQFFALSPDLMSYHWVADHSRDHLATLSETLAASGTHLIHVPVPPKSLVLTDALPPMAAALGFDAALAASVYGEALTHLHAAGVDAVDARHALREAHAAGEQVYFGADPRLTPTGGQALAAAIAGHIAATPRYAGLPKAEFQTVVGAEEEVRSLGRMRLQVDCTSDLPPVRAPRHTTSRLSGESGSGLFAAGDTSGPRVVMVGTDLTGSRITNLSGALAEASGLPVEAYAVEAGGAFAAISSYLTSDDFAARRPDYLVWIKPTWASLAAHGDQPMRELIAAAGAHCPRPLPVAAGLAPQSLETALGDRNPSHERTLFLDLDSDGVTAVRIRFAFADGQSLTRAVHRHPGQALTGRFFVPIPTRDTGPALGVEILAEGPIGPAPRLALCADPGES